MADCSSGSGASGAPPKAPAPQRMRSPSLRLITSPTPAQPVSTSPPPQSSHSHTSAGAPHSALSSQSPAVEQSREQSQQGQVSQSHSLPSNRQSQSPFRFVSTAPSSSSHQEINEKVRDAFDDLELGGISLSQAVYSAEQEARRASSSARSKSRARSRGREDVRAEQMERNGRDKEWDEKRELSQRYNDGTPTPGPSDTRQTRPTHQARPGPAPIQGPLRSSSLSSASFAHQQAGRSASSISHSSSSLPPPYSSLSSLSSASSLSVSAYPYASYSSSVRRWLLIERIRPWVPFLLYGATSLGFVLAIAFWKEEVFGGLDDLARWLQAEGETGYAVLFFLIFLTCIPPLPLYSTLQVLSGYTFGAWNGACLSYFSALTGALFVFSVSRSVPALRSSIASCLAHSSSLKRVMRAVSRRPSLLFLVRLAPYPYNVMNALLAACPRLTFKTYSFCTALSLTKVIIHTSVGAGIKSFAEYHVQPADGSSNVKSGEVEDEEDFLGQASTVAGIVLCIAIAIYLSVVARRAVDEELEDDAADDMECGRARNRDEYGHVHGDEEERAAFLASESALASDFAAPRGSRGREMEEMAERDGMRLGATSPAPMSFSSRENDPYGPPEWTH